MWVVDNFGDNDGFGLGFILMFLYCINFEILNVEIELGYWVRIVLKYFFVCVLRWWICDVSVIKKFWVVFKFMMFLIGCR